MYAVRRYTIKQSKVFRHLSNPKRNFAVGPVWLQGGTKLHGTAQDGDPIKLPQFYISASLDTEAAVSSLYHDSSLSETDRNYGTLNSKTQ